MTPVATPPLPTPGPVRRRSPWRLALVPVAILFALGLAEIAVRLFHLAPPVLQPRRYESPRGGVPFERLGGPDADPLFAYQPNVTFSAIYDPRGDSHGNFGPDGRVTYEINARRMREVIQTRAKGPATQPDAAPYRIVCLGDSFTFGEGVRSGETYPDRLLYLLDGSIPGREVEVFNAGVQAYDTPREVWFYQQFARDLRPDVVIVAFCLNDACDTVDTIAQNDAMNRALTPSWLTEHSALWSLFERRNHAADLQASFFAQIRRGFATERWDACRDAFAELRALAKSDHFRVLVAIFPIFSQLDGDYPFTDLHAKIAAACRAADLPCLDLLPTYRGRPAESLWAHPTDQHPNALAHDLAAKAIAKALSPPPASDPPPPTSPKR